MNDDTLEQVSGLDDILHDVTLTDEATGAPLTTGTVSMVFCRSGTATPLNGSSSKALSHVGSGRWTATHDLSEVATAIADVPYNGRFDRVVLVTGAAARTLAHCKKVHVVDES